MVVSGAQQRDSAVHIYVSILSQTPLPSRLPHNIEQSSLYYAVGPCWLSFLDTVVYHIFYLLLLSPLSDSQYYSSHCVPHSRTRYCIGSLGLQLLWYWYFTSCLWASGWCGLVLVVRHVCVFCLSEYGTYDKPSLQQRSRCCIFCLLSVSGF